MCYTLSLELLVNSEGKRMIRIFMIGMSTDKGGVEAYISNLCGSLDPTKFEVVYCCPEMNIDGKQWICPPNRHNYIKYVLFWRKFYRENHFDVLYLNACDIVSIDQLRFAKKAEIPIRIIHSHSTANQQGVQKKMSLFHRFLEKRNRRCLHKFATTLLACSESAGNWMYDGRDYQIVRNGIQLSKFQYDTEKRSRIRNAFGYTEEILVGIIGRLDPEKNAFFALEILEKLLEKNNIKAVFVGEGEQRGELQEKVSNLGLENKITFVGAVDNVHEWMSAIDCLLMPSLFEGLPFALVEAQAAGLPCIVSSTVSQEANISGLVEYISLEELSEYWTDKVLVACAQPRKDKRDKLVDEGYSIEDTAKQVSEIIEKALSEGCV